MSIRPVKMSSEARPTTEGAGVHLHRIFGFGDTKPFDPFLMMDDFRNDDPQLYKNGFPWHPHRGIETITYVLKGTVDHGDSLGNVGTLGGGDIQWMTAGSGIIHQEMPKGDKDGAMHGFQLWANLPSSQKMTTPRYQDIKSQEISEMLDDDGSKIRIIAGNYRGYKGPVDGIAADGDRALPIFLRVARASKMHQTRLASRSRKSFRAKSWKFVICRAIAHWWFLAPVMRLPSPQAMKAFGSC